MTEAALSSHKQVCLRTEWYFLWCKT